MRRLTVLLAAVALALPGCGEPSAKIVPAAGVLTINGKPAGNITVTFMPDIMKGGFGPSSYATTAADGTFTLTTTTGDPGAAVGPHMVTLIDNEEDRPAQGTPQKKFSRLDPKYAIPNTGLTAEVKEGGGKIELAANGPGGRGGR